MNLRLPQLEIITDMPLRPTLVLVGGGRPPADDWLRQVSVKKNIWCIDHGIDICKKTEIVPERLIGDNDSASTEGYRWAMEKSVKTDSFPPEKDFTDTQLSLKIIDREYGGNLPFVLLTGCFGGRLDHLLSTVFSFAASTINGVMADERELLLPLKEGTAIEITFFQKPKAVSLLPLSEQCFGVTTAGLKWELYEAQLWQKNLYTVSNELKKDTDTIKVSIQKGTAAIYSYWE